MHIKSQRQVYEKKEYISNLRVRERYGIHMKYDRNDYEENAAARYRTPAGTHGASTDEHSSPADELQAAVCTNGARILNILGSPQLSDGGEEASSENAFDRTDRALKELGSFQYNIGFAGEQSCGKSTVVNSLLQYPLMPTCNLTTTCTVVRLVYSQNIRIIATDDDTGKRVFDQDCSDISEKKFMQLMEYVCMAMPELVIDNISYFTEKDIYGKGIRLRPEDIDMRRDHPREVALLILVLLAVYIGQNDKEMTDSKLQVVKKREEILRYFGIPEETVNYSVLVQWDCDLLKSGLIITDLPGLGASAAEKEVNGKILKSHDDITKTAIRESDSMVFIEDDTVKDVGTAALREMLSSSRLKEVVNKGDRIIPLMNKADRLKGAQLATSQMKFVELLLGANVKKEIADIMPYAAIYGEYGYQDISYRRLLYMQSDDAKGRLEIMEEMGASEEQIEETLTARLKEKYDQSGIEELKRFFRTTYVERGKYHKAIAAVYAVRALEIQTIAPLESRAQAYKILGDTTLEAVRDITGTLKDAAVTPINQYIGDIIDSITQASEQTQPVVEMMLESTGALYQKAFEEALDQYRKQLLDIADSFELTWGGAGFKAQIDVVGSGNYNRLKQLRSAIETFPVDVVAVNSQYEKILGFVDSQIDMIYQKAIKGLESLKKGLTNSIGACVVNARSEAGTNDDIARAMNDLGGELLEFVDKQLSAMNQNLAMQRDSIAGVGNSVVEQVMRQNSDMTGSFTGGIKNSLNTFMKNGILFSKRSYLMIDGSDGLKSKIQALALTQEEKNNMEVNIRSVGSTEIVNKLNAWIDETYEITNTYSELETQIKDLMNKTAEALSDTAGDNRSACEELLKQTAELREEFDVFRAGIRMQLAAAAAYFQESDPDVLGLCAG